MSFGAWGYWRGAANAWGELGESWLDKRILGVFEVRPIWIERVYDNSYVHMCGCIIGR